MNWHAKPAANDPHCERLFERVKVHITHPDRDQIKRPSHGESQDWRVQSPREKQQRSIMISSRMDVITKRRRSSWLSNCHKTNPIQKEKK
jgi:hypothetical protein